MLKPLGAGIRTVLASVLLLGVVGCGGSESGSSGRFSPARPETLVVATAFLPAPGFWEGPVTAPTGGFEHDLAEALATRFGIDRIEVVQVDFPDLVAGDLGGADIALSQVTPTAERDEVLDFSTPYLSAPPGVLVRPGTDAPDLHALRRLRWVTVRSSTLTVRVTETVRPLEEPLLVEDRDAALAAIREERADALLLDLPVALARASAQPEDFEVVAQLPNAEGLAVVLPNGSPNDHAVDSAIRSFIADGTIDRLSEQWIGTALATGADDIPLIRTAG